MSYTSLSFAPPRQLAPRGTRRPITRDGLQREEPPVPGPGLGSRRVLSETGKGERERGMGWHESTAIGEGRPGGSTKRKDLYTGEKCRNSKINNMVMSLNANGGSSQEKSQGEKKRNKNKKKK